MEPAPQDRRRWMIECGVVAAVAVLPDLVNAIGAFSSSRARVDPMDGVDAWAMVAFLVPRSIAVLAVVGFIIWRSGEPLSTFGIKAVRARDFVEGVLVYIGSYAVWFAVWLIWALIGDGGRPDQAGAARAGLGGAGQLLGCGVASIFNGTAEQMALAGFLLPRLRGILGQWGPAVMIVALTFGAYHIYQGALSAVGIAAMGVLHGGYFVLRRRVAPLVFAHVLADFVGMSGVLGALGL